MLNFGGQIRCIMHYSYANPRLRLGFPYLSRILPTPLVFISGYANTENVFYCLIIPRVLVGYELAQGSWLAIIISYPTSASGIIILLKTLTKYREFFQTSFVKTTDFQLVFNFEKTHTVTIFGEHGIMAHIP